MLGPDEKAIYDRNQRPHNLGRERPERARRVYSRPVDLLLAAARPWTYWMALPLTLMAVLGVLGVVVGYLLKAVAAKYPKQ